MSTGKETIIVTGSNGLIGSALIERLSDSYNVVGFDIKAPPESLPLAEFQEVDLTSDDSVSNGLRAVREKYGESIASVIHLAAYYDFTGEESPMYETLTVQGTERLLRHLQELQVQQFIFSSTMLVHAPCEPGQRINEDWPLDPRWAYPKSKVRAEEAIRSQRGHIPALVLRIAGVYDDVCHSPFLSNQIQRIYEQQLTSRVFPGDITHGQAYIHLDDLTDAFVRAIDHRRQLPQESVFIIGEPETLGYDEIQRELGRLIHGEEWVTQSIPKPVAKAGAWVLDNVPIGEEPFIKPWMIDFSDDHYALDTL
jgi:nucleoside-diphosphate-sugar epimerase